MKLQERTYGGTTFRPTPEIYLEKNGQLMIIATPWGTRASAKSAIRQITDYVLSSNDDPEATSPFSLISTLSPAANNIRVAMMLANDAIYHEFNKNEYLTALEMTIITKSENQLCIAHVGHPSIFISRQGMDLQNIATHADLSYNYSSTKKLPPLPAEFIGIYPTSNMKIQVIQAMPTDQLVFLSRSHVPNAFYAKGSDCSLEQLTDTLVIDDSNEPFWVGRLEL